ncbi:MAG: double zinc ribbon domain-containing protein [Oscillospiraceae bacterium]|nr:double zinc ribbon domain-containing protein [Oscillospiraceae bacterium]
MGQLSNYVLEKVFPPKCNFCGHTLKDGEKGICDKCVEELPWIDDGEACGKKIDGISTCVSALWLQGNVFESIRRYKFRNCSLFANTYGRIIADRVRKFLSGRYDIITWVPLSEERKKKRGYDQAMLIAMAAALELDDVAVETLRKEKDTSAQIDIQDVEQRRQNVQGAYEISDPALVEGMRILLVDDVVTTGSTLSECAMTLRDGGAEDVLCVTLARARDGELVPGELDEQ